MKVLLYCLCGFFVAIAISSILAVLLLKNPFTSMLEEEGILTTVLDSTGILRFFIMQLKKPNLEGNLDGEKITEVFDRKNCTVGVSNPIDVTKEGGNNKADITPTPDGGLLFDIRYKIPPEKVANARFQTENYVNFIYNQQIGSFMTKDKLAEQEKGIFAEHTLLVANRRTEELSNHLRDFGRHVAEHTKPQTGSFMTPGKIAVSVAIIALIIVAVLFGPKIWAAITGAYATTAPVITQSAQTATQNAVTFPR
jgi:hypothetical protein